MMAKKVLKLSRNEFLWKLREFLKAHYVLYPKSSNPMKIFTQNLEYYPTDTKELW